MPLVHDFSNMKLACTLPSHLFIIHFNITFHHISRSFKRSFAFSFSDQNCNHFSYFSYTFHPTPFNQNLEHRVITNVRKQFEKFLHCIHYSRDYETYINVMLHPQVTVSVVCTVLRVVSPHERVPLEKLTVPQLVQEHPAFYDT